VAARDGGEEHELGRSVVHHVTAPSVRFAPSRR